MKLIIAAAPFLFYTICSYAYRWCRSPDLCLRVTQAVFSNELSQVWRPAPVKEENF